MSIFPGVRDHADETPSFKLKDRFPGYPVNTMNTPPEEFFAWRRPLLDAGNPYQKSGRRFGESSS